MTKRKIRKGEQYALYEGEVEKIKYIGNMNTDFLENKKTILNEPTFALNYYLRTGAISSIKDTIQVKDTRDIICDALFKLSGKDEIEMKGACVGYDKGFAVKNEKDLDCPTHFVIDFIHKGKVVSIMGYVADVDAEFNNPELYKPSQSVTKNQTTNSKIKESAFDKIKFDNYLDDVLKRKF